MEIKAALIAFVEDYLKSSCVPVHRVAAVCEDYSWMDFGLRQALPSRQGYRSIQNYLKATEGNTIYHLTDMFGCAYTVFRLPDSEELMVCGPVMFGDESFPAKAAEENPLFPIRSLPAMEDFYQQVTVFQQPTAYYNIFKHLGLRIYGEDLCKIVYDTPRDPEFIFDPYQQDAQTSEESALKFQAVEKWFSMEAELTIAVSKGKEDDILDVVSRVQSTSLPPILPDGGQNIRACMISLDTVLRKSVEMSGVPPIFIDPYSRRHIQLIAQTTNRAGMDALLTQFIRDYYLLIHRHSLKKYSLLTQKIITLIGQDITADLSLSAISEKLSSNAKYLSALFRREVGMTLTDYVNERRVKLAERLLLFTDFPIKMIAHRCGIPDVHYFSHLFKKKVGCAPKAFRENHVHV